MKFNLGVREIVDPARLLKAMHGDHVSLETALCALSERTCLEGFAPCRDAFARLERTLLEHLRAAEEQMFPRLAQVDAEEVLHLRHGHTLLRRRLGELGVALQLQTLTAAAFDAFVDLWRVHATHEELVMERWSSLVRPAAESSALLN